MTDTPDFVGRLRMALPSRWFPDQSPVLNGVLSGLAAVWDITWQNLQYLIAQTRILSATGAWLDGVANDFFGAAVIRAAGTSDADFRTVIQAELLRVRNTRDALEDAAAALSGADAAVFEPTNIRDTGACGSAPSLFYLSPGSVAGVAQGVSAGGMGGYANGRMVFDALLTVSPSSGISDQDLQSGLARVMPCSGIAWVQIEH